MNRLLPHRTGWTKILSLAAFGSLLATGCGDATTGPEPTPTAGSGGQVSGAAGSLIVSGASSGLGGTSGGAGANGNAAAGGAMALGGQAATGGSAGASGRDGTSGSGGANGGASGHGGASGNSGAGGAGGGAGGAGGGGSQTDCNSVVGQPVLTVAA